MKITKRLLALVLALILAFSVLPSANAYTVDADGTVYTETEKDFFAALKDSKVATIIHGGNVTFSQNCTIPQYKYVEIYGTATVASGATVTLASGSTFAISFSQVVIQGTMECEYGSVFVLYGAKASGSGRIQGTGTMEVYDTNSYYTDNNGNFTSYTPVYYSSVADTLKISSVRQNNILYVNEEFFLTVDNLDRYQNIYINPSVENRNYKIVIDRMVSMNANLYTMITVWLDNAGNRLDCDWVEMEVVEGGHLVTHGELNGYTMDLTVKNGAYLTITGDSYFSGQMEKHGHAGRVIIEEGGEMYIDSQMELGAGANGYPSAELIVKGKLDGSGTILGNGAIRLLGEVEDTTVTLKGNIYAPFLDTRVGKWYQEGIRYVVDKGLFQGMGGGKFGVGEAMTRAQLVTVMYRLAGSPSVEGMEHPFKDVEADDYFADAVTWAYNNNVVSGIAQDLFGPKKAITREQMIAIFFRYCGASPVEQDHLSAFSDGSRVAQWAQDAMNWGLEVGLIKGLGETTLGPKSTATREQVATFFMRFVELSGE